MIKKILKFPSYIFNRVIFKLYKIDWAANLKIEGKLLLKGEKKAIEIGENVIINSNLYANPIGYSQRTSFWVFHGGHIIIGNNVGISNASLVSKSLIKIGDDVLIGGGCKIYDTDFHQLKYENRKLEDINYANTKKIVIEEGVFLGAGSIVLKGVRIGKGSIIGAGSVVTKNIPPFEIWAGNPACFIRSVLNE